ncbi:hypothetical protein RvY_09530 [Ramazzottius varieornatus]|uniref:Uncharacterized protein n=1 Tax=Ramazzottius varieornatus TaxID=947166 RepID=A0A1D1VC32_RAMVA|nr:hypothetical protein RvY_09530 [Ramazzottius varieornatus]
MEATRKLRTDCVEIREAVQKLQNIADLKMFEHARRGRLEQRVCEDLGFIRNVITDMNAEYKILTHQLEIISMDKLKYYDEYPNMVRNFQKHSYETVMECRKDFLRRLEMSLLGMKDQSRNLRQLKYYKKFLKDENKGLK